MEKKRALVSNQRRSSVSRVFSIFFLKFICSPANPINQMMSRHPEVKWDEREDRVYLKPDVKNHKVNVDPNGTFTFSGSGGTDNN
ncbi:hypothetical protein MIMGU_mgv1a026818mg, partial [Erythranthe guttata]